LTWDIRTTSLIQATSLPQDSPFGVCREQMQIGKFPFSQLPFYQCSVVIYLSSGQLTIASLAAAVQRYQVTRISAKKEQDGICVTSVFRSDADETCALLGYYAV